MKRQSAQLDRDAIRQFHRDGYLRIQGLLDQDEVERYRRLYDLFLGGVINTGHLRTDLAGAVTPANDLPSTERITQIMWPSALVPTLVDGPIHRRAVEISRNLFGGDMEIDFDMLISKAPHTDAPTPWHQDAAYWVDLLDRRSASIWVALDEANVENGCLWFVPGSHLAPIRRHRQTGGAGALECECSEAEGVAVPLRPGDATVHHGGTLHYSRGNSTNSSRRAIIVNCRPEMMIRYERKQGADHGLSKNVRRVRASAAV